MQVLWQEYPHGRSGKLVLKDLLEMNSGSDYWVDESPDTKNEFLFEEYKSRYPMLDDDEIYNIMRNDGRYTGW